MIHHNYKEPKLVFKTIDGTEFTIEYGMAYYPGCFTPTGIRDYHIKDIKQWCQDNDCGIFDETIHTIHFRNNEEMMFFILRWS